MNREIKFRGKGIEEYDKDTWYYGSYFKYNEINYFCLDDGSRTEEINEKLKNNIKHKIIFEMQGDLNMENHIKLADVNVETVGQYTGLHDKNGKEIFEGDIVKVDSNMLKMTGIVTYNDNEAMFVLEDLSDKIEECLLYMQEELEVIGNIYDNFKLLRGE